MTTLTGYDPDIRFYATRYKQGGRTVYSLDLSLTQIAELLPALTRRNPTEGNRRIKEVTPAAFGEYVRDQADWVAPALVLRGPDIFAFETKERIGGTEFGVSRSRDSQAPTCGSWTGSTGSWESTSPSRASRTILRRRGADWRRPSATEAEPAVLTAVPGQDRGAHRAA